MIVVHYPSGEHPDAPPDPILVKQIEQAASEGKWLMLGNRFASFLVDPESTSPAALEKALASVSKTNRNWIIQFIESPTTQLPILPAPSV